jgi:hypothetical protein
MKIVIDISDEEYKTLSKMSEKEKVNELSYYERVIANGIPYEHKGGLISREALKETAKEKFGEDITSITLFKIFEELIDNAPTVIPADKENAE